MNLAFLNETSSMKWLCQLYIILKEKNSDRMSILTCNAAVWSRFVRWVSDVTFIAFIAFIFHDILTTKCVSASREIHCHKNWWQNGEDRDCNHEGYFQFWKWKPAWCILVFGHYITILCQFSNVCPLCFEWVLLHITTYGKNMHISINWTQLK